jgi:CO/xanthine dehydrogenase Mo-binding subunit
METRGLLFEYDAAQRQLTGWGTTKCNHPNRTILARLLGLAEGRIHFFEPDVGGGFGARGEFYPEDFLVPFAAMRVGRPVKWIEDRREHFQAINHSREQVHEVSLALRKDGAILGLHDRFAVDMGAYIRTHGVLLPELTSSLLAGPYRVEHYCCEYTGVLTNKTPVGTYRSPGLWESNFVRERIVDLAAGALRLDPAEVRRRNLIPPEAMPYRLGTTSLGHDVEYDSGDYPAQLRQMLDHVKYPAARAEQAALRAQGVHRGIGICAYVQKTGSGPFEGATLQVDPAGEITIRTGASSLGQGLETALAQIAQDTLPVGLHKITVRHGNTDDITHGTGSYGSRGTVMAGSAVLLAAERLRERALGLAERHLEASRHDLELADGRIAVRGAPSRGVTLGELAALATPARARAEGTAAGLQETAFFTGDHHTFTAGVTVAIVDVDAGTGGVSLRRLVTSVDVGRSVNPILIEGQMTGGAIQGVGGALYEHLQYDEQGQLLTTSFMDYLLPTAVEAPPVEVLTSEFPSPHNPLRVKGVGENGITGVGAAIANAVADALAPLGAAVITRLPLDPEYVAALARGAGDTEHPT